MYIDGLREAILALLDEQERSMAWLARQIGMNRQYTHRLLRGTIKRFRPDIVRNIENALNVRFDIIGMNGKAEVVNLARHSDAPRTVAVTEDVARHDRMVALVERMLDLHKRLAAAKTPTDKTLLQRQIAATDAEIDRLVYDLYGLTDEEIAVVEGRSV